MIARLGCLCFLEMPMLLFDDDTIHVRRELSRKALALCSHTFVSLALVVPIDRPWRHCDCASGVSSSCTSFVTCPRIVIIGLCASYTIRWALLQTYSWWGWFCVPKLHIHLTMILMDVSRHIDLRSFQASGTLIHLYYPSSLLLSRFSRLSLLPISSYNILSPYLFLF